MTVDSRMDSTMMTTAHVVETSVTNDSLSKDYLHPDDPANQVVDSRTVYMTEAII